MYLVLVITSIVFICTEGRKTFFFSCVSQLVKSPAKGRNISATVKRAALPQNVRRDCSAAVRKNRSSSSCMFCNHSRYTVRHLHTDEIGFLNDIPHASYDSRVYHFPIDSHRSQAAGESLRIGGIQLASVSNLFFRRGKDLVCNADLTGMNGPFTRKSQGTR